MKLLKVWLIVFAGFGSAYSAADSCSSAVVINMTASYQYQPLIGTAVDAEILKNLYKNHPNTHNIRLTPQDPQSKSEILEGLRDRIGDNKEVIFNFSGHGYSFNPRKTGVPMSRDQMIDATNAYLNKPPPAKTSAETGKKTKYLQHSVDEYGMDFLMKDLKPRAEVYDSDGAAVLATPECNSCYNVAIASCNRECLTTVPDAFKGDAKARNIYLSYCNDQCGFQNTNKGIQSCLKNTCITGEDLAKVFKGKKVRGMIDSCHSGGFKMPGVDYTFLASTYKDELANDTRRGGWLSNIARMSCERGANSKQLLRYALDSHDKTEVYRTSAILAPLRIEGGSGAADSCILPQAEMGCSGREANPQKSDSIEVSR